MYKFAFRIITLVFVLGIVTAPVLAQKASRAQLQTEIAALRQQLTAPERAGTPAVRDLQLQLRQKEAAFLAPDPADLAKFGVYTQHWDSGVVRLMPRETEGKVLTLRGGGTYYSFAGLKHEYGYGSDLLLERGQFSTGFAGANFGFLVALGEVDLATVSIGFEGVQALANYAPPEYEPDARIEQGRFHTKFIQGNLQYVNRIGATVGQTYAVRSINYSNSDILAAFQVVRQDTDGSLILVWKMLRRYPGPRLN
jgi:hypothetical protein